jgi:hypothetical protein
VDVVAFINVDITVLALPPRRADALPVICDTHSLVVAGGTVLARDINAVVVVDADVGRRRNGRDHNRITPCPVLRARAEPTLGVTHK